MATPPSQFAALLRRSKFASFDPSIGQVYTTFDGHAARGNFGLKRPLAIRRRNAHITVQAIDSREQQTVWRSAEPENRWIRMFDETGVTPALKQDGAWMARLGRLGELQFLVDSDLVPETESTVADADAEVKEEAEPLSVAAIGEKKQSAPKPLPPQSHATRNLNAMTDDEFDWYLRRIRKLRPAFREYLLEHGPPIDSKSDPISGSSPSLLSQSLYATGNHFRNFLEHKAYVDYHQPRPRHIEQQPHRFAGLSYSRSTPLQTLLNNKPHIGRVVSKDQTGKAAVVATVGMTSALNIARPTQPPPSVTTYRFNTVTLEAAPTTVGIFPQGLEGVKMTSTVRIDSEETRAMKENPYRPASKAYIAYHAPSNPQLGMTSVVKSRSMTLAGGIAPKVLLRSIEGLAGNKTNSTTTP
ncbi:mitochondrial ribosomal protein subunit-domain-containing protein [Cubamyces menziesii]|uniref:Uncharacterized protein n=1 Tax=Trametes cubensis TaxID=1111947 RepID=A0AAD7XAS1_9APHY|nr:mitochondrial ribosomal protein subunit-domain-containing protein [Cubamyces menziesii]KAJ8487908.1 hypothetical protein ONZ51_g3914 [Trametes cubensis]